MRGSRWRGSGSRLRVQGLGPAPHTPTIVERLWNKYASQGHNLALT